MDKFSIKCPCCEAAITIDAKTGSVIFFEEKKQIHGSFDELQNELKKKANMRDQLFAQEMSSVKDRERLLEEKFQEALKKAGADTGEPFRNPLDMD